MPLQNRVTPSGDIIVSNYRGNWMGNRGGQLHRTDKSLTSRRWVTKSWICCRLKFKGRHRKIMAPGRYTELFFLDEASAVAAGHRPCAECRHHHFTSFIHYWSLMIGESRRFYVKEIDTILHQERIDCYRQKITFLTKIEDLPSGCFIKYEDSPWLILNNHMLEWNPGGYLRKSPLKSSETVQVLTPRSLVALLNAGYPVKIHDSAYQL